MPRIIYRDKGKKRTKKKRAKPQPNTGWKNPTKFTKELNKRNTQSEAWFSIQYLNKYNIHGYKQNSYLRDVDCFPDFVWEDLKLIVEIDGGYHKAPEQAEKDRVRDNKLKLYNYEVIRIWHKDEEKAKNTVSLIADRLWELSKTKLNKY